MFPHLPILKKPRPRQGKVRPLFGVPRALILFALLFGELPLLQVGLRGGLRAQEPVRPVTATYTFGIGSSHLTDTYLSPLHYDGWGATLGYSRMQAPRFSPDRLVMMLDASLALDRTLNPARNATMWGATLRLEWGMARRWQPIPSLTLAAGGTLSLEGGALYNDRNGNNPASAKGAVTLNLTGYAAWRTRVGRLPVTLTWRPTMPMVGAFFSPDYGELYYEIYLGNRSGLVHAAWPGSYFTLDNLVAADLHLWRGTALRIGYQGRVHSSKACGIITNTSRHTFILGITGNWISYPM